MQLIPNRSSFAPEKQQWDLNILSAFGLVPVYSLTVAHFAAFILTLVFKDTVGIFHTNNFMEGQPQTPQSILTLQKELVLSKDRVSSSWEGCTKGISSIFWHSMIFTYLLTSGSSPQLRCTSTVILKGRWKAFCWSNLDVSLSLVSRFWDWKTMIRNPQLLNDKSYVLGIYAQGYNFFN